MSNKKTEASAAKSLVLDDKTSTKLLIYFENNDGLRMEL